MKLALLLIPLAFALLSGEASADGCMTLVNGVRCCTTSLGQTCSWCNGDYQTSGPRAPSLATVCGGRRQASRTRGMGR